MIGTAKTRGVARRIAQPPLNFVRRHGMKRSRCLFWFRGEPNFGDLIGPYLFEIMTGKRPEFSTSSNRSRSVTFFSCGSILEAIRGANVIVWGSGIMSRSADFTQPLLTTAVRGPETRSRFIQLGYECPETYGDPALLLPLFYDPKSDQRHTVGIVPHYVHYGRCRELFKDSGSKIIDVTQPVESVVDEIASCDAIFSSSLHGIIVAHAYRKPATWITFGPGLAGDNVKFIDYFRSVGLDAVNAAYEVTSVTDFDEIIDRAKEYAPPKIDCLIDPLLDACPFGRNWPG